MSGEEALQRALRAGALEAFTAAEAAGRHEALNPVDEGTHTYLAQRLRSAAARHDDGADACAHADTCARCAHLRAAGAVCALPSCGAQRRGGGGGGECDDGAASLAPKKLQRCARCRSAAYCGVAHQRADWKRHKDECVPQTTTESD
jgi:hypothetical protein